MNVLHHRFALRRTYIVLYCLALQTLMFNECARAINITVDYRYDTNSFFNTQQKKDALQAAADRFSGIITETLTGASLQNNSTDPRIGFTHPGTGAAYEVSPATNAATDALATCSGCYVANEYRGPWSIAANEWILYAGARSLTSAAEGGTGTGLNFTSVFTTGSSHLNRNFRSSGSVSNLPVWGGVIAFDNDGGTTWHFNHTTTPAAGTTDFYSIALHEIGHVLGLSSNWNEWSSLSSGSQYFGPQAVAAYNSDNGTSVSALNRVSASNPHWKDATYDSFIFQNANPNLVATVGAGALQDLLMEPTANFTGTVKRFELTNVDVAALVDVGWSVVPQINVQPGDYNHNGIVDAADYVMWGKGLADGNYATWRANFSESLGGSGGLAAEWSAGLAIPEPSSLVLLAIAMVAICLWRRKNACSRG